jgi:hypothetical protein
MEGSRNLLGSSGYIFRPAEHIGNSLIGQNGDSNPRLKYLNPSFKRAALIRQSRIEYLED